MLTLTVMKNKVLGERLREVRREKDVSIKQLASKLGIVYPYISQIESGKRIPSLKLIFEFSNFFNLTLDKFLGQKIRDRLITLSWLYVSSVENLTVKEILRELEKAEGTKRTKQIFRLAIERPTAEEILEGNKKFWEETKRKKIKPERTPKMQSFKISKKPIIRSYIGRQKQSSKKKPSNSSGGSEEGEESEGNSLLISVDLEN